MKSLPIGLRTPFGSLRVPSPSSLGGGLVSSHPLSTMQIPRSSTQSPLIGSSPPVLGQLRASPLTSAQSPQRATSMSTNPALQRQTSRTEASAYTAMAASFALGVEERRNGERLAKHEELIWKHHAELQAEQTLTRRQRDDEVAKTQADMSALRKEVLGLTSKYEDLLAKVAKQDQDSDRTLADINQIKTDLQQRHETSTLQAAAVTKRMDDYQALNGQMVEDVGVASRKIDAIQARKPQFTPSEVAALHNILA
jgi:hypothetical protein